jgi:transcriptional regulator with XRE-family HTH domain
MKVKELGEFIRDQRKGAQLTIQKLARSTGVSVPYLSQIERGLRRPSAEILQAIAKGLRMSAETLYVRAGILDERKHDMDVRDAIMKDPGINERQRQSLLQIDESFRAETTRDRRSRKPPGVRRVTTG